MTVFRYFRKNQSLRQLLLFTATKDLDPDAIGSQGRTEGNFKQTFQIQKGSCDRCHGTTILDCLYG